MGKVNFRFVDENGNNLNQFRMLNKDTSETIVIQLFREANITQVGTPLNASNMNALVSAINGNADDITELKNKKYVHNIRLKYVQMATISFILFSNSNTPFTTLEEIYNAFPISNKKIFASGSTRVVSTTTSGAYEMIPIDSVIKVANGFGFYYMNSNGTEGSNIILTGNFSIVEVEDIVI